jgi:hypothetical protein
MTTCPDILLAGWKRNLDKTMELLAGIPNGRAAEQPGGVINHPAWTLAHLNHYHPAILSLVAGEPVHDPGDHPDAPRFDAGSTPVADPDQYPALPTLIADYRNGHEQIDRAMRDMAPAQLQQPPGLARWVKPLATTAGALNYLMLYHESTHIGQIMVWRRAAGFAPCE